MPIYVHNPVLIVVGGVQPDMLKDFVGDLRRRDGFAERIMWFVPPVAPVRWSEAVVSRRIFEAVCDLLLRLRETPGNYRLTPKAKGLWAEWNNTNSDRVTALYEEGEHFLAGVASKMPRHVARLALVFHAVKGKGSEVQPETMTAAMRFGDYLFSQAVIVRDLFPLIDETPAEYSLSKERQAVINVLREHVRMTPAAIALELGRNPSTVRGLLRRMEKAEQVASEDGEYYLVEHTQHPQQVNGGVEGVDGVESIFDGREGFVGLRGRNIAEEERELVEMEHLAVIEEERAIERDMGKGS